jgi:hypothetical protein
MIAIFLILFFVGLSVWGCIYAKREQEPLVYFIVGVVVIVIVALVGLNYYYCRIQLPNDFIATCRAIDETKELIGETKEWDLKDAQMHGQLSELILKQEMVLSEVRKAMQNPFLIIRPIEMKQPY